MQFFRFVALSLMLLQSAVCWADKIAIIGGSGAVGSYFTLRLVEAGHEVTILGRPHSQHLNQVQANGLVLHTSDGVKHITPEKFRYVGPFNSNLSKQDLIIVSLKQPDLNVDIAKQIKHLSKQNTAVAIIANGIPFYYMHGLKIDGKKNIDAVDADGRIINELKNCNLIGIQPFIAAEIVDNGIVKIIRQLDNIPVTVGATSTGRIESVQTVVDLFQNAQIKAIASNDLFQKQVLEKLQFALSVNVLSALMDSSIDQVFIDPETQPLIKYVINVIDGIAAASHVGTLRDYQQFQSLPVTKGHYSSLYKDIRNNKRTEIAAIVDATLELSSHLNTINTQNSVNVEPLEYMRELLSLKIKGDTITKAQLEHLFNMCSNKLT